MAIELAQARPAAPKRSAPAAPRGVRLTAKDRMFFTERLELLLQTGMRLHVALGALRDQAGPTAMGELLETVLAHALKDENRGVRFVAAMTAGKREVAVLLPLVEPLLDDPAPSVRAAQPFVAALTGNLAMDRHRNRIHQRKISRCTNFMKPRFQE